MVSHILLLSSGPYILVDCDMLIMAAVRRLNKKRKM